MECGDCQIGGRSAAEIGRPDIVCAVKSLAEGLGVRDLGHGKPFFCAAFVRYGDGERAKNAGELLADWMPPKTPDRTPTRQEGGDNV